MYNVIRVKDVVRIPPSKFGRPLEEVALEELRELYEGTVVVLKNPFTGEEKKEPSVIVTILRLNVDPSGKIIPGDGATYHNVEFEALVFHPQVKEVVEGEVVTVTKNGLYVDLGVLDGFIYINQVADEKVSYDAGRGSLLLEESKKYIEKGDVVRARIFNVSPMPGKGLRVHMTMRQPSMGKIA
ncbi:MAG: DNA-directed RNA polymerase [Thermosphaera sp.]